jgi:hypothetical protein
MGWGISPVGQQQITSQHWQPQQRLAAFDVGQLKEVIFQTGQSQLIMKPPVTVKFTISFTI